jgi:pyridoxine 4-dehydrogenase
MSAIAAAGTARLGSFSVNRMGYGAMQLAGRNAFGPRDAQAGAAVLREAVAQGVNHIDTSDYYGPYLVNELIRDALSPYPDDLVLVTKIGARRDAQGNWLPAFSRDEMCAAVHDNLRRLGRDVLDVVNLRLMFSPLGPAEGLLEEPLTILAELQHQGLIKHLGVSNVTPAQVAEARALTEIVCVQNAYNIANRGDDALIDDLAAAGIAYVPFFPLGGFARLQSAELDRVAKQAGATALQVALAWLLQRSPNLMLIAGTSSLGHLQQNFGAAELVLPPESIARLDAIAASGR